MTKKADFTDEEWKHLLQAPTAAGLYIMMADPNFIIGSMQEAIAVSAGILAKEKENNCELLSELLSSFKERDMVKEAKLKFEKKDIETIKKTALEALKKAVEILDAKTTPEEAAEIKQWLYDISVRTANAAKEGGFLGIGGTRVSEKEKEALKEIAQILGVSA